MNERRQLADSVALQAEWCDQMHAPFAASILREAAADIAAGGPAAAALDGYPPVHHSALRLLAAVHRLVLDGGAPALARHFPSAGGDGDARAAWPLIRGVLASQPSLTRSLVDATPVQTNEPARSAALLGGFLEVARRTRLPLRILELGASAGLNLRWDRFRYRAGERSWGPASSPVVFDDVFDPAPAMDVEARVAVREGCDLSPIAATTQPGRSRLRCLVWPDHVRRLERLDAAIEVARAVPARVEQSSAAPWLAAKVAEPVAGVATVVFHSIISMYLAGDEQARIQEILCEAADRATAAAPLYRLWMEPGGELAEIRLFGWPGGTDEVLGHAGYHGTPVVWDR